MKCIRILLADDHAVVVEGLRRILERAEFEVIGVAADGRALVEKALRLHPDVIITDVAMPVLNGIDAVREVVKRDGKLKVIFLTMHDELSYARAAFATGASGYVLKSAAGGELIDAIHEVIGGGKYVSKTIASDLKYPGRAPAARNRGALDGLTDRQREVLRLLAEGRQVKEIAAVLKLSPKTVEYHKYRIMEAAGVRTAAGLTRYALKYGIAT
jgi:DNA-binding NarL/FixJ family response regulator